MHKFTYPLHWIELNMDMRSKNENVSSPSIRLYIYSQLDILLIYSLTRRREPGNICAISFQSETSVIAKHFSYLKANICYDYTCMHVVLWMPGRAPIAFAFALQCNAKHCAVRRVVWPKSFQWNLSEIVAIFTYS